MRAEINQQPQEERKATDVKVPLGPKQLHVNVVVQVRVHAGVLRRLWTGIFLHLPDSIWGLERLEDGALTADLMSAFIKVLF